MQALRTGVPEEWRSTWIISSPVSRQIACLCTAEGWVVFEKAAVSFPFCMAEYRTARFWRFRPLESSQFSASCNGALLLSLQ